MGTLVPPSRRRLVESDLAEADLRPAIGVGSGVGSDQFRRSRPAVAEEKAGRSPRELHAGATSSRPVAVLPMEYLQPVRGLEAAEEVHAAAVRAFLDEDQLEGCRIEVLPAQRLEASPQGLGWVAGNDHDRDPEPIGLAHVVVSSLHLLRLTLRRTACQKASFQRNS